MDYAMWTARTMDMLGIVLRGDGVVGLLNPQRHTRLWRHGPDTYRRILDGLLERPGLTRVLSAAEVAAGVWVAQRAEASGESFARDD
jgi:hypothetical protein